MKLMLANEFMMEKDNVLWVDGKPFFIETIVMHDSIRCTEMDLKPIECECGVDVAGQGDRHKDYCQIDKFPFPLNKE